MPELPEAETIARTLHARLRGKTFAHAVLTRDDIVHGDPRPLCSLLPKRRVDCVRREGKRVVIQLDHGATLVVALGMTGRLTLEGVGEPVLTHTHLRIGIAGSAIELRFRDPRRFGGIWFLDGGSVHVGRRLAPLGDDPLQLRIDRFRELLACRRQIKALLIDQRVIAGMGNIYCDEALHRAGVHPQACAMNLTPRQSADLLRGMRNVLRAAIRHGGTTFMDYRNADGRPGGFRKKHRVYGLEGLPCGTCKTPIVRIIAAGRSTHLCPRCQRPPRRRRS